MRETRSNLITNHKAPTYEKADYYSLKNKGTIHKPSPYFFICGF